MNFIIEGGTVFYEIIGTLAIVAIVGIFTFNFFMGR